MKLKTRLAAILMLLLIAINLTACKGAYSTKTFTSAKDYSEAKLKCVSDIGFQIIPKSISEKDAKDFFAEKNEYLPVGTDHQLFLEMNYSQDDFDFQIERLKRVEDFRKVKYDTDNFNYPAYVGKMGLYNTFEYALVDEESLTVRYVYFQGILHREDLNIDEKYLPKTYTEQLNSELFQSEGDFKDYNYSIYSDNFDEQYGY